MSTFSTLSVRLPSYLLCQWDLLALNLGRQSIHQALYDLRSRQIHWALSITTRHFAHMIHRRHFPVMSTPLWSGTSFPGPVASYSVHRNTGAKRREQRKLRKGETLNICRGTSNAGPIVQVSLNWWLVSVRGASEECRRNGLHFSCGRLRVLLRGMCCIQLSDDDNK